MNIPTNSSDSFGPADTTATTGMTVTSALADAPHPTADSNRPAVSRLFQGDRANLIVFNFLPGQSLNDHKAAHPITVQGLSGSIDFSCGTETVRLEPGVIVHVPARVIHRVDCPLDATQESNVMLLTMLTES